jgi:hypothetical protein
LRWTARLGSSFVPTQLDLIQLSLARFYPAGRIGSTLTCGSG